MKSRDSKLTFRSPLNQIEFSPQPGWFNPLFYKLQKCDTTYIINYGSGGSGKSHATAQNEVVHSMERKHRTLVLRKVAATLKESVVEDILSKVVNPMGIAPYFKHNKSDLSITNTVNGSKFIFKGLDDVEKIKSISGITRVWIEEASELSEHEWNVLNDRIRGNPQITLSFNPISEDHWLKARFCDEEDPRVTVFHTTYLDNPFVGQKFREDMEWHRVNNFDHFRVYGLGEWGTIATGQEFFDKFRRSKHVRPIDPDYDYPFHLWFDFNNLPYSTCVIVQMVGAEIRIIDEICLKPPGNTIEDIAEEFFGRYAPDEVYYSGDPTGRAKNQRKSRTEKRNYFEQIHEAFAGVVHGGSNNVPRKAPPIANRRITFKRLMTDQLEFTLVVDPKCVHVIGDFERLVVDDNGGFLKKKVKDKQTDQTYEERGHCADAITYGLFYHFKLWFKSRKH